MEFLTDNPVFGREFSCFLGSDDRILFGINGQGVALNGGEGGEAETVISFMLSLFGETEDGDYDDTD